MHWFADALELQDSLAGIRVGAGHVLIDFLRDENLVSVCKALEASSDIDNVAHHGVVLAVIGTNQRRTRHTGGNAHPDPKQVTVARLLDVVLSHYSAILCGVGIAPPRITLPLGAV